jgi:hypothetical protein
VKVAFTLLAASACLMSAPAFAQGASSQFDAGMRAEPDTQVLGFIRIPLGHGEQKDNGPRIGFGLFHDCSRVAARISSEQRAACDAAPIRSLEMTRKLHERDWLVSFTNDKRWVGLARLYADGFGSVREYGPVFSGPAHADELD